MGDYPFWEIIPKRKILAKISWCTFSIFAKLEALDQIILEFRANLRQWSTKLRFFSGIFKFDPRRQERVKKNGCQFYKSGSSLLYHFHFLLLFLLTALKYRQIDQGCIKYDLGRFTSLKSFRSIAKGSRQFTSISCNLEWTRINWWSVIMNFYWNTTNTVWIFKISKNFFN